jgi:hypothetical protein
MVEGWPDVPVKTTGRIERSAPREKRRQVRGDEVAQRGRRKSDEKRWSGNDACTGMDCSIVKCANAVLRNRTVVGLAPR